MTFIFGVLLMAISAGAIWGGANTSSTALIVGGIAGFIIGAFLMAEGSGK